MFEPGEARTCPECGLALTDMAKLGPSYEASLEDPEEPIPPHMETLPWTYAGRGRALIVTLALAGLGAFFAPWVRETAPEIRVFSGFDMARRLGWMWAPAVAFFVMIPLVLTRRSIHKMRGARFAIGFLALVALMTVALRVAFVPTSSPLLPVRFEWGLGLYGTGAVALAILAAAVTFGGRLDDLPTAQRREGGETLH
jgi:hypothetical protein